MNIKSLLLGSAAAMVAVSGAQAADAVVVEAEPVEYVRVCDAYGSGYFFIPGTETCIRFGGYVRTQYSKLNVEGDVSGAEFENTAWSTRTRLDVDTRNETEWGTLRSLIRLQSNNGTDDGGLSNFEVDQAFITIAGLRAGIGGSLFNANFAAGMNLEGVPQIFEDGIYGFSNSHVLDYTYSVDGLSLSVGIEDNRNSGFAARGGDASDVSFLAKVQYSADFGTVGAVGEFAPGDINDAYKVYATLDLSEFLPGGTLGGFYAWQDELDGTNTSNGRLGGADSVWGVGLQMNLTDNLEFIAYHNNLDDNGADADVNLTTIGLNWYPVSGLKVFGAYSFGDDVVGGPIVGGASTTPAANGFIAGESVSYDQFLIGLRRNF
jgi:hypothetical protein